ncbi:unnamed protein product, partial [Discosporangium mesarthrocarpum]
RRLRRQGRRDKAAEQRQKKHEEAKKAMEEEAGLFPEEEYRLLLLNQEEEELKDIHKYLALVTLTGESEEKARSAYGGGEREANSRTPKRPGRKDKSLYMFARKAGLRGLANKFTIGAAQVGELVAGFKQRMYPVPTPEEDPELVASDMAGASDTPMFSTPEAILKGVRHMLARELAAEPRIKALCRMIYNKYAEVSTLPTSRGLEEIDSFHPLYGLHYLTRKPVRAFMQGGPGQDKTQWLRLERGQKQGLLKIKVHPPEKLVVGDGVDEAGNPVDKHVLDLSPFIKELAPHYIPEGTVEGVAIEVKQGWDKQRRLVLEEALEEHLVPTLEKEIIQELQSSARAAVVEEASIALEKRLAVGPFEREDLSVLERLTKADSKTKDDQLRVVGVFISPNPREESYAVSLDPFGAVVDHLELPFKMDQRADKLKAFILVARPHVVCVSTSGGQASRKAIELLYDRRAVEAAMRSGMDMEAVEARGVVPKALKEYQTSQAGARGEYSDEEDNYDMEWRHCSVVYQRDDVATIFARSARGEKEFPDYHVNLRAAVGLARYLQDPIVEMAGMWTTMDSQGQFGQEMFSLKLHPMQDEVPAAQLLRVWTQRMVDAVNDVGVDINHAVEYEHAKGTLTFVAGLVSRRLP